MDAVDKHSLVLCSRITADQSNLMTGIDQALGEIVRPDSAPFFRGFEVLVNVQNVHWQWKKNIDETGSKILLIFFRNITCVRKLRTKILSG